MVHILSISLTVGDTAYNYGPPMMGKMGGSDKKFVAPDAVSNQPLSFT